MLADSEQKPRAPIWRVIVRSWVLVVFALLYVGWVFVSRWQENRALEQKAAAQKRAEDQRAAEALGGSRFDILNFYASPGIIRRGDPAQLCYGVSNAKSVRLEPPSEAVWPSQARCITISPSKSTTFTLTAEDSTGNSKTATVVVQVR